VIAAHRAAGLRLRRRIQLESWSTLVLTARRQARSGSAGPVRGWISGRCNEG
jgi:hypothetical protein